MNGRPFSPNHREQGRNHHYHHTSTVNAGIVHEVSRHIVRRKLTAFTAVFLKLSNVDLDFTSTENLP